MLFRHPLFTPGGAGVQDLLLVLQNHVSLEQSQIDEVSKDLVRIDKMTQLGASPEELRAEIAAVAKLHALQGCGEEELECICERIAEFSAKVLPTEFDALEYEPPISEDVMAMHGLEMLANKCSADNARGIAKALRRGNALRTVLENTDTVSRKRGRTSIEEAKAIANTSANKAKAVESQSNGQGQTHDPLKLEMGSENDIAPEDSSTAGNHIKSESELNNDDAIDHKEQTPVSSSVHHTPGQKLKRKLSEHSSNAKAGNKQSRPGKASSASRTQSAKIAGADGKRPRSKHAKPQQNDADFQDLPPVGFRELPPLPQSLSFSQAVKHTHLLFSSSQNTPLAVGGGVLFNLPVLQNLQVKCGRHSPWGVIVGDGICVARDENGTPIDMELVDSLQRATIRVRYEMYTPREFVAQFQDKPRWSRGKATSSDVRKTLEVRHSNGLSLGDYIQTLDNDQLEADDQEQYIGVSSLPDGFFLAKLSYLDRTIELGAYRQAIEAAKARDRALIRAKGASYCEEVELNFPLSHYVCDPSAVFTQYDDHLRLGLIHSGWPGPSSCDFSAVLVPDGFPRLKPERPATLLHDVGEAEFDVNDDYGWLQSDDQNQPEAMVPRQPKKPQPPKPINVEQVTLTTLCDLIFLLRTPDNQRLLEALNKRLVKRGCPKCTEEQIAQHLSNVAWRIEECPSCPWFVTKAAKREHFKKRENDPWDEQEFRTAASLIQSERSRCILTLNKIFRHNYNRWTRNVKQIDYMFRRMCVKVNDIWVLQENYEKYASPDPEAVLAHARQELLDELTLLRSFVGKPGVSEELRMMLQTLLDGNRSSTPQKNKSDSQSSSTPTQAITAVDEGHDESEPKSSADLHDDLALATLNEPPKQGRASKHAAAEAAAPMVIDSDDYEEESPTEPTTQSLTPDTRIGPLLKVQYSSSPFGSDQERRCRQRMDSNSIVQNLLGMKKIISFDEFDSTMAADFVIPHDICFMLGAIFEHDPEHNTIDEIVNAMRERTPTRSRQQILEFVASTKAQLQQALPKKRYTGVKIAGKDTFMFVMAKRGFGYFRSSLEAHLLRQQMPGSDIGDKEEFASIQTIANMILEYMQPKASF